MMQTPTLEVYEDDSTIPRRKKRRSSAGRRVSFAETKTVHIFQRDDEYATPPMASPLRRSPRLAKKFAASPLSPKSPKNFVGNENLSVQKNIIPSAAEDGPVDMDHLRDDDTSQNSSVVMEDDITLDSTTFSTKFNEVLQENNMKSPWTSDMSFTDQIRRRPLTPVAARPGVSPSSSVDKCLTMQYTEIVEAGTLAARRRRVFKGSPCAKKLKLDYSAEKEKSPFRKPLEDITTSFLLPNDTSSSFLLPNDAELPATPVPTLGALLNRDPTDTTEFFAFNKEDIPEGFPAEASCNRDGVYTGAEVLAIEASCNRDNVNMNTGDKVLAIEASCNKDGGNTGIGANELIMEDGNAGVQVFSGGNTGIGEFLNIEDGNAGTPGGNTGIREFSNIEDGNAGTQVFSGGNTGIGEFFANEANMENGSAGTQVFSNDREDITAAAIELFPNEASCKKRQERIIPTEFSISEPRSIDRRADENRREERKARMAALVKENQESREKIAKMKKQLATLNSRIQQHSSSAEHYKTELKKRSVLQKIQGWQSTNLSSKENVHTLDTNYAHKINQRISIEGNEFATLELVPNWEFIEMGFPRINASPLFQALLPQHKIMIRPLKCLPAALERASSVVLNLIHVAREAVQCRVEYRCLTTATFFHDSVAGICLRFSFENYRMRLKVTLLFQLHHLTSGQYPKNIVPSSVVVEFQKATKNMITEQELRRSISNLPAGYRRFHRVCACVSSFF